MKISFENKILFGFIINSLLIIALWGVYTVRIRGLEDIAELHGWDWVENSLFVVALVLLVIVYIILRRQTKAQKSADKLIADNRLLLLSIINNTSNPISIKKINGEYLLVNDQFRSLFQVDEDIIGKSDHDFLPKEIADGYRSSDLEVIKAEKELKLEEEIVELDGKHTYLSVKFPLLDDTGRIYAVGSIGTDITERKTSEESLEESGTFFNLSLDVMVIATEEKFVKINPSLSRILGYKNKELLEKSFTSFIYPDDVEMTEKEIKRLQSGENTINFVNRWVTKDNKIVWLNWVATIDKKTNLFYAVAHDVTEHTQESEELKTTKKFFDISYDLMAVVKEEHFSTVNAAFTRVLGLDRATLENKSFVDLIHPDDVESAKSFLEKLKHGEPKTNFRARTLCLNKKYRTLEWTAISDIDTGIIYTVARDVTDLLENEKSLDIADTFFNLSSDSMVTLTNHTFLRANSTLSKTLGYTEQELLDQPYTAFIEPEDLQLTLDELKKLETGSDIVSFKNRWICKDKSTKSFSWTFKIVPDSEIIYGVGRDITEQLQMAKEDEETLRKLYDNEQKLRLIIDNIGDGVIVANQDKKILLSNQLADELFGDGEPSGSAILSDKFQILSPTDETVYPSQNLPMSRALKGEATDDVDVILFDPNTSERKRVLLSGRPLVDQDDSIVAAVITIKDISRYKELEEELKEAESKLRPSIGFIKEKK